MASESSPQYEYKPLLENEIRLVHLLPGSHEDDIRFTLVHRPLSTAIVSLSPSGSVRSDIEATLPEGWNAHRTPEGRWFYCHESDLNSTLTYDHPCSGSRHLAGNITTLDTRPSQARFEALSYAWGSTKLEAIAFVLSEEDQSYNRCLHVTRELAMALKSLRLENDSRVLWADAICIDQRNLEERAAQVQRMGLIYSQAWRVVVWVGLGSGDSSLAIDTLRNLGRQVEMSDARWSFRSCNAEEQDWWSNACKLPFTPDQWLALHNFFSRPWFGRLWVIQEIGVANANAVVACGKDDILFSLFRRAIVALDGKIGVPHFLSPAIDNLRDLAEGLQRKSLLSLLHVARRHSCTEAHDRIYGLLGFFGSQLRDRIRPSYDKPYAQLCREVFLQYSDLTGRLDFLAHCLKPSKDFRAPSWVPDWRSNVAEKHFTLYTDFQASGASKACHKYIEADVLACAGVTYGSVSSVIENESYASLAEKLRHIIPHDEILRYPTGGSMLEAWTKLVWESEYRERFPEAAHGDTLEQLKARLVNHLIHQGTTLADHWPNKFRLECSTDQLCRSFFRTEAGHIGFGPKGLQEGDQLCVLLGLHIPLILRPTSSGRFILVGSSYVEGLMNNVGFLGQLPSGYVVQQHLIDGRYRPRYFNAASGETSVDDPRLPSLSAEWSRVNVEPSADEPSQVDYFQNSVSGEIVNYDPRLLPEHLELRGVKLEIFELM